MLLEVFLILLAVTFIIIGIGYGVKEASFVFIGLAFLFVLSTSILIPNNLEVVGGENKTTTYNYNNISTLTSTTEDIERTYTNPNTRFYGIWLAVLAGGGFYFTWRLTKGGDTDE